MQNASTDSVSVGSVLLPFVKSCWQLYAHIFFRMHIEPLGCASKRIARVSQHLSPPHVGLGQPLKSGRNAASRSADFGIFLHPTYIRSCHGAFIPASERRNGRPIALDRRCGCLADRRIRPRWVLARLLMTQAVCLKCGEVKHGALRLV